MEMPLQMVFVNIIEMNAVFQNLHPPRAIWDLGLGYDYREVVARMAPNVDFVGEFQRVPAKNGQARGVRRNGSDFASQFLVPSKEILDLEDTERNAGFIERFELHRDSFCADAG
jgi:hypothetical protein